MTRFRLPALILGLTLAAGVVVLAQGWRVRINGVTVNSGTAATDTICVDATNQDACFARGAANRLDLGSGDSLRVQNGEMTTLQDSSVVTLLAGTYGVAYADAVQVDGSASYGRINLSVGNHASAAWQEHLKTRSTDGSVATVVQANDELGRFNFSGTDGTQARRAAAIIASVDGTPGSNDMPGRLSLWTTPDGSSTIAERVRVDQAGNVRLMTPLVTDVDAQTVADSGDANPAAATITPASSYVEVTCNDANTCDITLGETGVLEGTRVTFVNLSANVVDFADTSGVTELAGAFAAGQYDTISLVYLGDRWVETARSNN